MKFITCGKAPCKSCPYRTDVPSGVWAENEYVKLPAYDGSCIDQAMKGAVGMFYCHQQDGKLCAGWVATHGAQNLLAMRLGSLLENANIDPEIWDYKSPVPVFKSGAEAAEHGKREIMKPGPDTRRMVQQLVRKQERRKQ